MKVPKSTKVLIDVTLDKIEENKEMISSLEKYMTKNDFINSNEVDNLYSEIKELCGHIFFL